MMDKSWMSKPRTTEEYKNGVEQFLSFAFRNVREGGKVYCPCIHCRNKSTRTYDDVKTHLRCDGILQGYATWVRHGEEHGSTSSAFANLASHLPYNVPAHDKLGRTDDMQGLLSAAFGTPNNDDALSSSSDEDIAFGFPDIGDIGSEDDFVSEDGGDEAKQDEIFASFLKDADTKLYSGCEAFSKLSFIVTLFHLKCLHGWTQESFTALLGVLSYALPQEANLPKKYHEAKNIIQGLGLNYVKIHACPKDCMLFWGDKADQEICHVCKSSRWADEKNKGKSTGSKETKKKPAKVLRYFPLIPRLKRFYATEKTSDEMRWHDEGRTKDELLRHPADGQAWKDFDANHRTFSADSRNVRLGLASDGFNPFRNMNSKHSTWPVVLIPYNLPPWICMKQTSFILSMIIPGPDSPGNDIDVYLQPLIDELLQLWEGVETFDASSKKKFSLRAALLWTLNDFPALAYLSGWSTKGKFACPSCADFTRSIFLKKSRKCSYMGHRRWLPQSDTYRHENSLFDGTEEAELAPKPISGSSILKMLEGRVFEYGKKDCQSKRKVGVGTQKGKRKRVQKKKASDGTKKPSDGTKKPSDRKKKPEDWLKKRVIFFQLPYWKDNLLRHNLDVMHIEKIVCDNLIGTLLNMDSKTKDDLNARLDLVGLGLRPELQPRLNDKGKQVLPDAPFTMSQQRKEIRCSVIQNLSTPDGYASNLSRCVNMKECKVSNLKSHDCHVLIEEILPIALRSCYPSKEVMRIVVALASFFKKLCSRVLDISKLNKLQEDIVRTLCDMEKIFLPSFFTVMVHLLVHLVEEAKLGGPVHYRWMYPMERLFVRLKALVRNRAYPEGSIAEGYIADECLTFCSRFLDGTTRFTRPSRNPEPSDEAKQAYLFHSAGEPIGKVVNVNQFDNQLLVQAHRYVLRHCDELEGFRRQFMESMRTQHHHSDLTPHDMEGLVDKHFADWLEQKRV